MSISRHQFDSNSIPHTESPYIAVVAAERMREELTDESHRNGKVHRYSAGASVKVEPADALKVELDPPAH